MFVVNLFGCTFTWTIYGLLFHLVWIFWHLDAEMLMCLFTGSCCWDSNVIYMHVHFLKIWNTRNSETHLYLWLSERGWWTSKVHWVDVDLSRALANWPVGQIQPLPAFVNKILLTHSHIYLFTYCLWLPSSDKGELSLKLGQSLCGCKVQKTCSLDLYKKSADIWSRLGK